VVATWLLAHDTRSGDECVATSVCGETASVTLLRCDCLLQTVCTPHPLVACCVLCRAPRLVACCALRHPATDGDHVTAARPAATIPAPRASSARSTPKRCPAPRRLRPRPAPPDGRGGQVYQWAGTTGIVRPSPRGAASGAGLSPGEACADRADSERPIDDGPHDGRPSPPTPSPPTPPCHR
jgi:hypothetical protein